MPDLQQVLSLKTLKQQLQEASKDNDWSANPPWIFTYKAIEIIQEWLEQKRQKETDKYKDPTRTAEHKLTRITVIDELLEEIGT